MNKTVHVLLADDDRDDRFFFEKALQMVSVPSKLSSVHDGEQLMRFLFSESLPDMLFLDVNMPRKNGRECLKEIKDNSKIAQLPVIIYSTSLTEETADEFYRAGANYFLQKCDFTELPELLYRVLVLLENRDKCQPPRHSFVVNTVTI